MRQAPDQCLLNAKLVELGLNYNYRLICITFRLSSRNSVRIVVGSVFAELAYTYTSQPSKQRLFTMPRSECVDVCAWIFGNLLRWFIWRFSDRFTMTRAGARGVVDMRRTWRAPSCLCWLSRFVDLHAWLLFMGCRGLVLTAPLAMSVSQLCVRHWCVS